MKSSEQHIFVMELFEIVGGKRAKAKGRQIAHNHDTIFYYTKPHKYNFYR